HYTSSPCYVERFLTTFLNERLAQPDAQRLRLHGLLDDPQQLGRQRVEVGLVTDGGGEGLDGLLGVVASAVEAPVDGVLHPAADGQEEGGDEQRGEDDGDVRLADEGVETSLEYDDGAEVNQGQQAGDDGITGRAAD